jgi:ankyrin repeat protein
MEPAHTTLAQSCLGVLLRLPVDNVINHVNKTRTSRTKYKDDTVTVDGFPLAEYAARHWVDHAQFGDVSSYVWKGMERLFDPNKPHFSMWLKLDDMDTRLDSLSNFSGWYENEDAPGTPLYYATLCGFRHLVEHLIVNQFQDVNARSGFYVTPLVAALAGKSFQLADLLYQQGAAVDVLGHNNRTLLHTLSSMSREYLEIMQWLINHGADTNVRNKGSNTPLHSAAIYRQLEASRILLQHNADVGARDNSGQTPLHDASNFDCPDVARLLLDYGADVNARDKDGSTPLHLTPRREEWVKRMYKGRFAMARLLLEHGADIRAEDNKGRTALQVATEDEDEEMMQLLSEHIAN